MRWAFNMKQRTILFSLFTFIFLLQACSSKLPIETNINEKVADFDFTTQDGEGLSRSDLAGKWWIADFIFTNCTTACLPMTSNMVLLQDRINEEGLDIELVSFSVDPDHDTPSVLREYGEDYGADFSNWHFLTGYDFDTIKKLSVKSFRAFLQVSADDPDQYTHDTRFFLVDPDGNIVKGYSGLVSESVDEIIDDLLILQEAELIDSLSN